LSKGLCIYKSELLLPLVLSLFVTLGCSTTNQRSPAATSDGSLKIIDAHTHTFFKGQPESDMGEAQYTQEDYFEQLKRAGAVGAVSHTMGNPESYGHSLRKLG
jgi:hypothetical protein